MAMSNHCIRKQKRGVVPEKNDSPFLASKMIND